MGETEKTLQFQLPLPVQFNGQVVKDFVPADIDGKTMSLLGRQLKGRRHFTTVARQICLTIESIGDQDIRQTYLSNPSDVKFPSIVLQLPLVDAPYLSLCSHYHNFGRDLNKVQAVCGYPDCGQKFEVDVDLADVQVSFEDNPIESVPVSLQKGYIKRTAPGSSEKGLYDGMVFKDFKLAPPTLGDAIRHEEFYNDDDPFGQFAMRLLSGSIVSMTSTEGAEMEPHVIRALGASIIESMHILDIRQMTEALKRLPMPSLDMKTNCPRCNREFSQGVDVTGFLEPRGRS